MVCRTGSSGSQLADLRGNSNTSRCASVHLKPDGAVQPTVSTKFQLPLTGQVMDVKPRALHVAKLAL